MMCLYPLSDDQGKTQTYHTPAMHALQPALLQLCALAATAELPFLGTTRTCLSHHLPFACRCVAAPTALCCWMRWRRLMQTCSTYCCRYWTTGASLTTRWAVMWHAMLCRAVPCCTVTFRVGGGVEWCVVGCLACEACMAVWYQSARGCHMQT